MRIVMLLSRDFALLVVIAAVVATPFVYAGIEGWLSGFAFRIPVQFWTFVQAGVLALFVAMLTMNYQTIRAALANPTESLRND